MAATATAQAIQFLSPDLGRWDALGAAAPAGAPELLVAPFFSDERPLRGPAGLADWRLCGRLSRLLRAGRLDGALGETALMPAPRLAFGKLLLVGLGETDAFDEARFRQVARAVAGIVARLGVTRYALALPGRPTDRIAARRALELWQTESATTDAAGAEVWLIEPPAVQKDLSEAIGRRGRDRG